MWFFRSFRGHGARQSGWLARDHSLGLVDMWSACFYVSSMTGMIQIRNVPEALHRKLKSRAALVGLSLSDYLLNEIREAGERPTLDELRARLRSLPPVTPSVEPAVMIREERDSR